MQLEFQNLFACLQITFNMLFCWAFINHKTVASNANKTNTFFIAKTFYLMKGCKKIVPLPVFGQKYKFSNNFRLNLFLFFVFSRTKYKIKFFKFYQKCKIIIKLLKFLLLYDTLNMRLDSINKAFCVYHKVYHKQKAYHEIF